MKPRREKLLPAATALLLLQLVAWPLDAEAGCVQVNNSKYVEYICEDGSAWDLIHIPSSAQNISISGMLVGQLREAHLSRFPELLVFACSHCRIGDIEDTAFWQLRNLQQLSLDNNHLKEVRAAWFKDLLYLMYLDLNYNSIERIDSDVFRKAPDLTDLRFSGNRLVSLDCEALSGLRKLKRIYVDRNPDFNSLNALKHCLANRTIDYEPDSQWAGLIQDRVNSSKPAQAKKVEESKETKSMRPRRALRSRNPRACCTVEREGRRGRVYANSSSVDKVEKTESTTFPPSMEVEETEGTTFPSSTEFEETEGTTFPSSTEFEETEGTTFPSSTEVEETEGTTFPSSTEVEETEGTTFSSSEKVEETEGTTFPSSTEVEETEETESTTSYSSAEVEDTENSMSPSSTEVEVIEETESTTSYSSAEVEDTESSMSPSSTQVEMIEETESTTSPSSAEVDQTEGTTSSLSSELEVILKTENTTSPSGTVVKET